MTKSSRALLLFQQLQPRFRTISWRPIGFPTKGDTSTFLFAPAREGYCWYNYPSLDLQACGILAKTISANLHVGIRTELAEELWPSIMAGPFAGRTFYADPDLGAAERAFSTPDCVGVIPIRFSHDGASIPGLTLDVRLPAQNWEFYIPKDTLASTRIKAAIKARTEKS